MKALVIHAAQDLRLEEWQAEAPAADELVVTVATGGVCGSDLHYYNHGGFGPVRLKEPMILGHEVAGYVKETGSAVTSLKTGDLVAISPSRPCFDCTYCHQGDHNHCEQMKFYGSAMPWPHVQGAFREELTVKAWQCVKADNLSSAEAAMAEPLSVALHATRRAGDLLGQKVLVTGCGPIGVLCIIAARRAGAREIIATDLADNALSIAAECGADRVINIANDPNGLEEYKQGKGYFGLMYECSGSAEALVNGIAALRPRAIAMQLGLGGDMSVPMMQITAKEIDLRGSFRFHEEFSLAIDLMRAGLVNVKSLVTHTVELADAENAFKIANDRNSAMKAQIVFNA